MTCLIAAATAKEIGPFLDHYRQRDKTPNVDVLITGIGLMATAWSLSRQVQIKRPDLVIQAGIAGCFDKNISLGSVVVVKRDIVADLGVMENKEWKTMFDLGLIKNTQAPFKGGWLTNPHTALLRQAKHKTVNAVSVNHITTDKKMSGIYASRFRPVVESMEGAALHYTGLMENIPFLQLRSISNYIGERDKSKWNIPEAIHNLNQSLIRLIETIDPKL